MTDNASENDGGRFDRLPATDEERTVDGRPSRDAVLEFWASRFGVPREAFAGHSFWEKGKGSVWAVAGDPAGPVAVQALGLRFLRTRQRYWKPTTNAVLRFGRAATRNVVELNRECARRFVRGESQAVAWDGDRGYLITATRLADEPVLLGVGLFIDGTLRSQVPKGRRVELREGPVG